LQKGRVLQLHLQLLLLPCLPCAAHLPAGGMQLKPQRLQQVLLLHPGACLLPSQWQQIARQHCLADPLHSHNMRQTAT
jgi:hypothetical protein